MGERKASTDLEQEKRVVEKASTSGIRGEEGGAKSVALYSTYALLWQKSGASRP